MKTKWSIIPITLAIVFLLFSCISREDIYRLATGFPDIRVLNESSVIECESGYYSFGTVDAYTTESATFSIENVGSYKLVIDSIYVLEENLTQFKINISSTSSVVMPGERTNFNVDFKPIDGTFTSANVVIKSNDFEEETFRFTVDGKGNAASPVYPDIFIRRGPIDLPSGTGIYDFGIIESGASSSVEFTIENFGSADLSIIDVYLESGDTSHFSVIAPSLPCDVSPGSSTVFEIAYEPKSTMPHSATVKALSDDPDEGSYTFIVKGEGSSNPEGDMRVAHGSLEILDGIGVHGFGIVEQGYSDTATFTIHNNGTTYLYINSINVTLGDFSVSYSPPPFDQIIPAETLDFDVTYTPSGTGISSATVTIDNSDPDENPYTFTVEGTGASAGSGIADIQVTNKSTGEVIPNGSSAHDFTRVSPGSSDMVTFNITNTGAGDLNLSSITFMAGDILEFSIDDSATQYSNVPTSGTTSFDVLFSPLSTGNKSATIEIASNDPDENPYRLMVYGQGSDGAEPDMSVKVGGKEYLSGTSYYFGTTELDDSTSDTFTIENKGTAALYITSVLLTGGNAGDFRHDLSVPLTVPLGNSVNVRVTFTPTKLGCRWTTLQIANDDPDENPYKINLRGNEFDD